MRAFLQELCEDFAENGNFSGVCLLKREDELVFEKAYGFANRAFRVPNTADTRFDTASVTKIFTAAAVLQLAEQGRLRLSDRITSLVDLSGTKIPEDVTIEQLLNHTSGIADDADEEAGESYAALFKDSPNYAIRECRDFLKNFAWKEPVFPAGTAARYCNCSYVLLGMAVEAVSGENYRDYYRKHIFEPAGMTRTAFLSMEEVNESTAEGYESVQDEAGRLIGYRKNIYSFPPRLLLPAPGYAGRRRLHHGRGPLLFFRGCAGTPDPGRELCGCLLPAPLPLYQPGAPLGTPGALRPEWVRAGISHAAR